MNTLLYNNRNGCLKICDTCKDDDKLYKYEVSVIGYSPFGYTEFTKKNEETKLTYSFDQGDPSIAKTDGIHWYVWDEDYNKWFVLANVDTNFNSNNNRSQWRTIIKCAN